MPAIVAKSSTLTTPFVYKPMTPPTSHRATSVSSASPSLSPAPTNATPPPSPTPSLSSASSKNSSSASPSSSGSPNFKSTSMSRSGSKSFSEWRYAPYPRGVVRVAKTKQEEDREVKEVKIDRLNLDHIKRSVSPEEQAQDGLPTSEPTSTPTPAPKPQRARPTVRPKVRAVHSSPHRQQQDHDRCPQSNARRPAYQTHHRRAYSMSQLSYGFMLFPSVPPSTAPSSPVRPASSTQPSHSHSASLSMSLSPFPMSLSALPSLASSPSLYHHAQPERQADSDLRVELRSNASVPTAQSRRTSHVRTQSAASALPSASRRTPPAATNLSPAMPVRTPSPLRNQVRFAHSPASSSSSRTPSPPLSHAHARSISPTRSSSSSPTPVSTAKDSRRLIFVNPLMAAHLKHGGMVSIKSVDGQTGFKVFAAAAPVNHNVKSAFTGGSSATVGGCRVDARVGGVEMVRSGGRSRF
ncbi:hypothetical protein IAU59_005593 [Kwoniella sp. CBS 9459]